MNILNPVRIEVSNSGPPSNESPAISEGVRTKPANIAIETIINLFIENLQLY
jgi:hypothetical protein